VQTCQSQNQPQRDSITKEEIDGLKKYVDEKFQKALNEAAIKAETRIKCYIRYNPNQKSRGFFQIKAGQIVHIIEARHKWVRITVTDPTDSLPITGWIMKKYLIRN
jgi:ApbE superfamily uncharacterized protein (UPF0280 family)